MTARMLVPPSRMSSIMKSEQARCLMKDRPNEIPVQDHSPLTGLLHEYKAMCAESCLVRLSPDFRRLDHETISEVLNSFLTCINDA